MTDQPGLFHQPEAPRDLDAMIERARLDAAAARSTDSAIAHVVRILAEGEGFAPVAVLLAHGVSRAVLADLVAEPNDKRARAKARLTVVGGDPYVHLTANGWQSSGRASGRERAPDAMSASHAMAPARAAEWIAGKRENLAASGVRASVASGAAIRRLSEEVKARAWASLRSSADGDGAVGLLTGGWLPDFLILTRFPRSDAGRALYAQCWGSPANSDDDLAESLTACEVEDSRKSSDPLRSKVSAAEACLTQLRVVHSVVWIVKSRDVATRLLELNVGGPSSRQLLVPARALGLDGDDLGSVGRPWWLTNVPDDV